MHQSMHQSVRQSVRLSHHTLTLSQNAKPDFCDCLTIQHSTAIREGEGTRRGRGEGERETPIAPSTRVIMKVKLPIAVPYGSNPADKTWRGFVCGHDCVPHH